MPELPAGPLASGPPLLVIEVAGRPNLSSTISWANDFVVVEDCNARRIEGTGVLVDDGVRFTQKSRTGKDVRTWHISGNEEDQFDAIPISIF